ncbi:hypothetical protein FSARC_5320 [Fusarium sarcochroum]|uniref:Uncharacterized protein n=1 Tax=Fusarium sarcochroum TaxID=1208366 RepID=A0A8H4TZZ7_9HYPO|nr:hypothetical protein FSARC_5320 [Fusarium sarcochroum]
MGQQKIIGRPRRKAPSANLGSTAEHPPITIPNKAMSPIPLQQNSSFMEEWSQLDWTGMLSPESSPPQFPVATMEDAFSATQTWPTTMMDTFDQPWNTRLDLGSANSSLHTGPDFGCTIPNFYSFEIPPTPAMSFATTFPLSYPITTERPNKVDSSDFIFDLSNINLGLHTRLEAIKRNKEVLDFDLMIYQQSPLFIDDITLAEFTVKASQDLLLILTKLYNTQHGTNLLCNSPTAEILYSQLLSSQHRKDRSKLQDLSKLSLHHPAATSKPLPAPIVLMITSIFIQLVTIYEVILDNVTTRVERIAVDPIAPVPGLIFGGRPLERPCTQGMLFCEVSVSLMEGIERVLGIIPISEGREAGLLSPRQMEMLGNELDERDEVIPGYAMMAPANLRKLFGKVADIFRSLN